MLVDKLPIEGCNKDYVVSGRDLQDFSMLYEQTIELESKYGTTDRKEKADELNEAYIRLRKIASKLVGAFSAREDRYAQVSTGSSTICYDNVSFLRLVHALLDQKEDYVVSTIRYVNFNANEECYDGSFSILTTKEGLKLLNKVPGNYLFHKEYSLNHLKKHDIPFVVTGKDINRNTFDNDVAFVEVRDLDSTYRIKYDVCYLEDDNIHNALEKINRYVDTNGVDLNGIEVDKLASLMTNQEKGNVLKHTDKK